MRLLIVLCIVFASMPTGRVSGQTVRVVGVAEFADESTHGPLIDARRMNAVLGALLADRSKGQLRVVAPAEVRAAMEAHRYTVSDLAYPSRAAEVALAVGADWLITGRWTYVNLDRDPEDFVLLGDCEAVISIRIVETATRKILLEDSFWSHGFGSWGALRWTAEEALRKAAERILQLQTAAVRTVVAQNRDGALIR